MYSGQLERCLATTLARIEQTRQRLLESDRLIAWAEGCGALVQDNYNALQAAGEGAAEGSTGAAEWSDEGADADGFAVDKEQQNLRLRRA
jgi:hypothetical protein